MDHTHAPELSGSLAPEISALMRAIDTRDFGDNNHLLDEVRYSSLKSLSRKALDGRLHYYEKEHLFERNEQTRREFKREIERTRFEIARRKAEARAEAAGKVDSVGANYTKWVAL